MKVELEVWHLFLLVFAVVSAFWAIAQMLIKNSQEHIADRFTKVGEQIKAGQDHMAERFLAVTDQIRGQTDMIRGQGDDMRRIERDLMGLKAELPRDYVRREDYTQTIATIMTKIDHATLLMQQAVRDAYAQAAKANPQKDHQA